MEKTDFRYVKCIIFIFPLIFFSGCYYSAQEVITASDAASMNGLAGTYSDEHTGITVTIEAIASSNDYRFESGVAGGVLRLIPLRDNVYIVQIKCDNEPGYYLSFYRFFRIANSGAYQELEATGPVDKLAQQYKVRFEHDFDMDYVYGDRSNILSFLRAHSNCSFISVSSY